MLLASSLLVAALLQRHAAAQTVYLVADTGHDKIQEFSTSGAYLGVFASTNLDAPTGFTFDSAGNLLVVNSGNNTIERFSAAGVDLGAFINDSTHLNAPIGAFSSGFSGSIFVLSATNNVAQYNRGTGAFQQAYGSIYLQSPSYYYGFNGIGYVTSTGNDSIYAFQPGFTPSPVITSGLDDPSGIRVLVGSSGTHNVALVANDGTTNDIGVYNLSNGTIEGSFGGATLVQPHEISFANGTNDLLVADGGDAQVFDLTNNGAFVMSFGSGILDDAQGIVQFTAIPEPGDTVALLGAMALAAGLVYRRKGAAGPVGAN